jgi:hypothetical protein
VSAWRKVWRSGNRRGQRLGTQLPNECEKCVLSESGGLERGLQWITLPFGLLPSTAVVECDVSSEMVCGIQCSPRAYRYCLSLRSMGHTSVSRTGAHQKSDLIRLYTIERLFTCMSQHVQTSLAMVVEIRSNFGAAKSARCVGH